MANDKFYVAELGSGLFLTFWDDGSGVDWIIMPRTTSFPSPLIDMNRQSQTIGADQFTRIEYFASGNIDTLIDIFGTIENAIGSNNADAIYGGSADNLIYGDHSNDYGGSDTLYGGAGDDRIYARAGRDIITCDEGDDRVFGGKGNDTLYAGLGSDTLSGGAGADVLSAGEVVAYKVVKATLDYSQSNAAIVAKLAGFDLAILSGGHAEGDSVNGFTDLIGSAFADLLIDSIEYSPYNDVNKNLFKGLGGNDLIKLGGNSDAGYGGEGSDTLAGDEGNDSLYGDGGKDALYGGTGDDFIQGGSARDSIAGGHGADTLLGGGGSDVFIYGPNYDDSFSKFDLIKDFSAAAGDKIDLSQIGETFKRLWGKDLIYVDGIPLLPESGQVWKAEQTWGVMLFANLDDDPDDIEFRLAVEGTTDIGAFNFIL